MRTSALRDAGFSAEDIRRAVRHGTLVRLRSGWLATPQANSKVVRAVRSGGVLGCASALAFYGAWDLRDYGIHIYRSQRGRQAAAARGLYWCSSPKTRLASNVAVLPIPQALVQAAYCLSAYDFVTVADSLVHRRMITLPALQSTLAGLSARIDRMVAQLDVAESGTESLVRLRLRAKGIGVRPQVVIPGVGRVDLLIGNRLVLEVDSREHHTDPLAYERDRCRDQELVRLGFAVMRVTYEQVMYGWPPVEARILAFVRAGWHRRSVLRFGP